MDAAEWSEEKRHVKRLIAYRKDQRRQVSASVFDRINNHVRFLDFQRQYRQLQQQSVDQQDDDDAHDSALEFLQDVNDEDMRSLLEAEVTKTKSNGNGMTPTATALKLLQPLEMPPEILLANATTATTTTTTTTALATIVSSSDVVSVSASSVGSGVAVATTSAFASTSPCSVALSNVEVTTSLSTDDKLDELMDSLDPALRRYGADSDNEELEKGTSTALHQQLVEQPNAKVNNPPGIRPEIDPKDAAVVHEMHSWVSGDRDPEFVKHRNAKEREEIAKSIGLNRKNVRQCTVKALEKKQTEKAIARLLRKDDVIVVSSDSDDAKERARRAMKVRQMAAGGSELMNRRRVREKQSQRVVSSSSSSSSSEYSSAEEPEESEMSSADSVLSDDIHLTDTKSRARRRSTSASSGRSKQTKKNQTTTRRRIRRFSDTLKTQSQRQPPSGKVLRISKPQLPLQASSEGSDSDSHDAVAKENNTRDVESMEVEVEDDLLDPSQDVIPTAVIDVSTKSSASNTSDSSSSSDVSSSSSASSSESDDDDEHVDQPPPVNHPKLASSPEGGQPNEARRLNPAMSSDEQSARSETLLSSAPQTVSVVPIAIEANQSTETNAEALEEHQYEDVDEDGIEVVGTGEPDAPSSDIHSHDLDTSNSPATPELPVATAQNGEDDDVSEAETVDFDTLEIDSDDEEAKAILTAQPPVEEQMEAINKDKGELTVEIHTEKEGEQNDGEVSETETVDLQGFEPDEHDAEADSQKRHDASKLEETKEDNLDVESKNSKSKSKSGLELAFDIPSGLRVLKKPKPLSKPMKTVALTSQSTPTPPKISEPQLTTTTTPSSTPDKHTPQESAAKRTDMKGKARAVEVMAIKKGKYEFQRRTTKMMDELLPIRRDKDVKKKPSSGSESAKEPVIEDPRITARRRNTSQHTTNPTETTPNSKPGEQRYLNYGDDQDKNTWTFSSATKVNHPTLYGNGRTPQVCRDRHIDIYDAIGIEEPESNRSLAASGIGALKRPSQFKKLQEKALANGSSLMREPKPKPWIDEPIPKRPRSVPPSEDTNRSSVGKARENGFQPKQSPKNGNPRRNNNNNGRSTWNNDERIHSARQRGHRNDFNQSRDYPRNRGRLHQRENRGYDRVAGHRDQDRSHAHKRDRPDSFSGSEYPPRKRTSSFDRFGSATFLDSPPRRNQDRRRDQNNPDRRERDSSQHRHGEKDRSRDGYQPILAEPMSDRREAQPTEDQMSLDADHFSLSGPAEADQRFDSDNDVFVSDSDVEDEVPPQGASAQLSATTDHDDYVKKRRFYCVDLDRIPVDENTMTRSVYVTNVTPKMNEQILEDLFSRFGLEVNKETGFPQVDVFLCQRNHRPRGDARIVFTTPDGAQQAIEELHALMFMNSRLQVRPLNRITQRILTAQFDQVRSIWICSNPQCHAHVSVWKDKCDKCTRRRVFPPNPVAIQSTDWLCAICFTANAESSSTCRGCHIQLPQRPRTDYYKTSQSQTAEATGKWV